MLVGSIDNNIVVRAEHLSIYYEIRFDKIKYYNAVLRIEKKMKYSKQTAEVHFISFTTNPAVGKCNLIKS